jgi:hypothetical protein
MSEMHLGSSGSAVCAEWAQLQQVDPIGTAGSVAGYLVVDWPLPWPRDIGEIDELSAACALAAGAGLRVLCTVPSTGGPLHVRLHRRPPGTGFDRFTSDRASAPADADALTDVVASLLECPPSDDAAPARTEVLVCTHGRRDRCCGARGTPLWRSTVDTFPGVEVRRTSHLGGHRFAPTALVLPYGTLWAHLDDASLGGIVTQTADVEAAAPRYRGCSGLDGPDAQALERAVFERVGWSLFARRRIVDVGGGVVRLVVLDGGRTESVWEATVQAGRVLPVPECGRPPENAPKLEAEHIVTRLARIA